MINFISFHLSAPLFHIIPCILLRMSPLFSLLLSLPLPLRFCVHSYFPSCFLICSLYFYRLLSFIFFLFHTALPLRFSLTCISTPRLPHHSLSLPSFNPLLFLIFFSLSLTFLSSFSSLIISHLPHIRLPSLIPLPSPNTLSCNSFPSFLSSAYDHSCCAD